MENKTDKNGKNTSFVEILAVLRCDFTILFRALSFSLDFIRFVHSRLSWENVDLDQEMPLVSREFQSPARGIHIYFFWW